MPSHLSCIMLLFTFPFYHLFYFSFYILLFFSYRILLWSSPIKWLRDKRRKRAEMQERRKIYFHPSTFSFFDDLPLFFVFFLVISHMIFFSLSFLYHLFCFLYFFTFLRGKKIEMGAKSKKKKHRKKEKKSFIN